MPASIIRSAANRPLAKKDGKGKTIHDLLTDLVDTLQPLYWGTHDKDQRDLIAEQMEELDQLSFQIFKNKIQTNTTAWGEAADALSAAIDQAEAAVKAIDKTVATLKQVGQVIALVAQLAAVAG